MSSPKLSELLLSYYLDDSQDSDSNSDGLEDLMGIFGGLNGYYYSGNDFYAPHDPHPALVDSAKRGDITSVKKLISFHNFSSSIGQWVHFMAFHFFRYKQSFEINVHPVV